MSKCSQDCAANELLQEQRANDRAGKAAGRHIVDVGDLGIQHRFVWPPERHAPQRIVLGPRRARQLGGERIVVGIERRQLRSQRYTRRAGKRAEIDQQVRLVFVGERQRVGEDEAASASVLPISTVRPLREG